jgi:hypothetical protein
MQRNTEREVGESAGSAALFQHGVQLVESRRERIPWIDDNPEGKRNQWTPGLESKFQVDVLVLPVMNPQNTGADRTKQRSTRRKRGSIQGCRRLWPA